MVTSSVGAQQEFFLRHHRSISYSSFYEKIKRRSYMSKQAVDKGHEQYLDAMRANDATAFALVLTEDVALCPPHEPTRKGKPEAKAWFEGVLKQFKTERVSVPDREVVMADGWAIEKGDFVWAVSPVGGGETIEDQGRFLAIWKRDSDGEWRVAHNIWNSSKSV
jgi:uncharacterized protein (TIGR02246 family)